MMEEQARRTGRFQAGRAFEGADGGCWWLPLPAQISSSPACESYRSLLGACLAAGDVAERSRADLCLAIFLLRWNYHLSPTEMSTLLGFASGSPPLAKFQRVLRAASDEHVAASRGSEPFRPRHAAEPSPYRRRWLERLLARTSA